MSRPKILLSSDSEKQGSSPKAKVLLLSSKTAGGHESIGLAVKQALEKKFRVTLYNDMPVIGARAYFYVHHYLPTFFNLGYRLTDNPPLALATHFFSFLFTLPALQKVAFEEYDLILTVQPFLNQETAWLLKKTKFVTLINDPVTFHQVWICPQSDLSLVTAQEAKKLCLKKGVPQNKVVVTGFPVRQQFFKKMPEKAVLRLKLNLKPNKFTVFVGGSTYGVRETLAILRHLRANDLQIIVACGRNQGLQKKLSSRTDIKVFSYVENIAELMKASDLIVSKAGPNLLFESIILGIPFFATGYPPEQEKGNLELIRKYKIGFIEENPKKAVELIKKIAQNPKQLKKFVPNLQKLAASHRRAGQIIVSQITYLLKNSTAAKRR